MRKFTKQISSLLALVAAGTVTGGVVNALNDTAPLTGDTVAQTCDGSDTESPHVLGLMLKHTETEETPEAGVAVETTTGMKTTYCIATQVASKPKETTATEKFSDKYSETEVTPTAGVPMVSTPEKTTATTRYTSTIGTQISSRPKETTATEKFSDKYSETKVTPTAGVTMVSTPEKTTTTARHTSTIGTQTSSRPIETTTTAIQTPTIGTQTSSRPIETTASYPESQVQRGSGDIDMNGQTEITDLTDLSLYLLKDMQLDENQLIAADVTKDGEVNLADLPQLKMILMHDTGED